jgi:hypothetical protein
MAASLDDHVTLLLVDDERGVRPCERRQTLDAARVYA